MNVLINGQEFDMEAVALLMDDELRERIAGTVEDEQEFVDVYRVMHAQKFGEVFSIN